MSTLKQIRWIVPVLLLFGFAACEPQVSSNPDLNPAPTSDRVTFDYTPNADNANIITFTNTSEGSFRADWDFGNGSTKEGDVVTGEFPLEGEYTVTLTIFTESGQAQNSQVITIAQTNVDMLNDPNLNMLTGGSDDADGKTWVIDSTSLAHMGVGPTSGFWPEWWQAPPEAKTGAGLYNDRYNFILNGFTFNMYTGGDVFLNGAYGDEFTNTTAPPDGADLMAPYENKLDQSFSLVEDENGDLFLTVSSSTHIGFYAGTRTYQILDLTENTMSIRYIDPNGLAWYHLLIVEGYERPVEPLPYTSEELADDFDTEGNVDWSTDQIAAFAQSYDNPAPIGLNTSDKVAKYQKGPGYFENVYVDLGYELNLNERPIVKMKAFMPSYNDYETVAANKESWSPGILFKQVEVKLHNVDGATGLGGNSWQTQATIIQPVDTVGAWVDLEFDFSGVADREDFDRLIIQIGGEGHDNTGVFFIDDFQLTAPAAQ